MFYVLLIFFPCRSETYSVNHENKTRSVVVRSSSLISRFIGDHDYAMRPIPGMVRYVRDMAINAQFVGHGGWQAHHPGPIQGNDEVHFTLAVTPIQLRGWLPDCQERNWMLDNGFYVEKFFWHRGAPGGPGNPQGGNTEGRRVDFLASTRTIPDMRSQRELERASRGREMISKVTCQAGLIKGVFTKPMTYTLIPPHEPPGTSQISTMWIRLPSFLLLFLRWGSPS